MIGDFPSTPTPNEPAQLPLTGDRVEKSFTLTTTTMSPIHRQGGDAASSAAPPAHHRIRRPHGGWSTMKVAGVGTFCFIGGMHLNHGSMVQINFSSYFPHTTSAKNSTIGSGSDAVSVDDAKEIAATAAKVFKKVSDTPVDIISLLGERHSGTNWITDHLQECFGDRIKVKDEYTRCKHWFQEDRLWHGNSAVVVSIFRDPMDWVEAMRWEPHHAHDHLHFHNKRQVELVRKEPTEDDKWWREIADIMMWKEFVTKPWVGRRGPNDEKLAQTRVGNESVVCLDRYRFVDATPCLQEDSSIVRGLGGYKYEYKNDGSERGFDSILDLRRNKVMNHLSVAGFSHTSAFLPYRFEDLKANGTAALLRDVEEATGLKAKCNAIYGKERDAEGRVIRSPSAVHRRLAEKEISQKRELSADYIEYMNRFVDWEVEKLIGYYPRQK